MKNTKPFPVPVRTNYSCSKCPAFCCTYSDIEVTKHDIERLARHFGIEFASAEERFTKLDTSKGVPLLKEKLTRFALFNRAQAHKMRLVAAAALAEVATDEAEAVLRAAMDTKNEEIHRACRASIERTRWTVSGVKLG